MAQAIQMQRKNDAGEYENYYPNTVMSQIEGDIQIKAKIIVQSNPGDYIRISGDNVFTEKILVGDDGILVFFYPYGTYMIEQFSGEDQTTRTWHTNLTIDSIKTYEIWARNKTLEEYSWAEISEISQNGEAANKFSVGDTKSIVLKGTMYGFNNINLTLYTYILDFNHDASSANGTKDGITFGTFKTALSDGIDVALCVNYAYTVSDTVTGFCINLTDTSVGGWEDCYIRYSILGSTNVQGENATSTTATAPVENTLMSCLPSDLRIVMKPMYIYSYKTSGVVGTLDFLPFLAAYEVTGTSTLAEKDYQTQYTYYKNGNSTRKKQYNDITRGAAWWLRSRYVENDSCWYYVNDNFESYFDTFPPNVSAGVAPMFKV